MQSTRTETFASYDTLRNPPFALEDELNHDLSGPDPKSTNDLARLPGFPHVYLDDFRTLSTFLEKELFSAELEKMAPYFWMMSLQSSSNISPLHRQIVKGREIILTEDPSLHLVWLPNRIFLKPLPSYLLSFPFWHTYLFPPSSPIPSGQRELVVRAALGYLRSYHYLVQYESDFRLAQEHNLVPRSVTWAQFGRFISKFAMILDIDVSDRYAFGELRLSRLNFYCKFILGKARIHRIPTTYGTYFSRFYAPILFVFAGFSVILSALQVGLGVEALSAETWPRFWAFSRVITLSVIALASLLLIILFSLALVRFVIEWKRAIKDRLARKQRLHSTRGKDQGADMA